MWFKKIPSNLFASKGGPLSGTHQLPHCQRGVSFHTLNSIVNWFVYKGYVQNSIGPVVYFRVSIIFYFIIIYLKMK